MGNCICERTEITGKERSYLGDWVNNKMEGHGVSPKTNEWK